MSTLSRIPGIAQLAAFLAATFSLQTNPTLRRYNDALAQTFYHHGRLCASNQATVMVLVIVFVGMISYPGIITSYNSSTYARQRSASTSPSSHNLSLSSWPAVEYQGTSIAQRRRRRHDHEGDLDTFWTHKVIAPTWTQDPDFFSRNLPFADPLHFIAPVIINATNLSASLDTSEALSENTTKDKTSTTTSLFGLDLFEFATQIRQRIEAITVDYNADDVMHVGVDRSAGYHKDQHKIPRLVSIKNICILASSNPMDGQSEGDSAEYRADQRSCLVHSPRPYTEYNHEGRDNRTDVLPSFLFGSANFDGEAAQEPRPTSMVIAYFLRGDLGGDAQKDGKKHHNGRSAEDTESSTKDGLDVRRVWRLVFDKLMADLQAERSQQDPPSTNSGSHGSFSIATDGMVSTGSTIMDGERNADANEVDGAAEAASHPSFMFRVVPGPDVSQRVSRRLVSEASSQPRTNISAEYWLLGMAYFVMFLYISLSVGRVDLVKSKYGLGFAAVTTVFVSLLMSIGLCSVFGVTLTLMPWEILPFMIIVVGVENINILVHAVVETSMDLPVRERVGRGLGTVGVSITLTLVAELCLLVIGAMTTIPAVQEFCTFAIAAVTMDYLLQMTFFITVISIDIRRLELSDLGARPAAPYPRHPFGPRHPSAKSGLMASGIEMLRFEGAYAASGLSSYEDERTRHRRNDSTHSHYSDEETGSREKRTKKNPKGRIFTSIIMVGVMAYLGYIYGTTNQSIVGNQEPVIVSYWNIIQKDTASEFWSLVDPGHTGGYLEIETPVVVTLLKPSSESHYATCDGLPDLTEIDDCEPDQGSTSSLQGGVGFDSSVVAEGQLDPRRPFKLVRDALVFICLFAVWLVRVFVIPSIILAAAILLLLSYLLSPQRKLLVDLQWRFPFIVLPGDYQSKRKLMMEELLAQEARELGQDAGPCTPLPGAVETLFQNGHKTDIDQMDISADGGLILSSSMDGSILLWSGEAGSGQDIPLARLEERARGDRSSSRNSKSRLAKLLKLDPLGNFVVAGFGDGDVHVWGLKTISHSSCASWSAPILSSERELVRRTESTTDVSKLRASSVCFWESSVTKDTVSSSGPNTSLLVGYRDGQIWNWNLLTGEGRCIIDSKVRGGISKLGIIELDLKIRQELGLRCRTYLVVAGKDGSIQCWSIASPGSHHDAWTLLWSNTGLGQGIGISVLSWDAEVPMVATGYSNGAINVWDLEQGNLIWTLSRGLLASARSAGSNTTRYLDRRHSQADNHQPSHQGAITKLCFHALELEDGLTGEPAPRVWLVISSSTDETVMVWIVEWEGLMCMSTPLDHSSRQKTDPSGRRVSESRDTQAIPQISLNNQERPGRLRHSRSFGPGEPWVNNLNGVGNANFLGTLSSSLPAPRLVGFMKQRGGKSMTVSNSCLYGVRRTESTTTLASEHGGVPKQSHASILDVMGPASNVIRSRRKSDSHGLTYPATSHDQAVTSSGPMKRGWELWEADLYQCIFRNPGVWGLDLTVRAVDLQPHQPTRNRRLAPQGSDQTLSESGSIIINSNGSAIAVPIPVAQNPSSLAGHEVMRPKLQRKPGSFTQHMPGQRGYMYTAGLAMASQPQPQQLSGHTLFPTQSGKAGYWGDSRMDSQQQDGLENAEDLLLPFVETRLIHALSRRTNMQQQPGLSQRGDESGDQGKEPEMKDIIVGFGNFIKIVRLQDEEDEEDEEGGHF
ncbi:hypothetical protein BC939DRAFT_441487 [Gamsiella multidivaricata]|uniref:uncharacterized protein n=1 Tax=Gamsiella multidivaricata TaxID=101098 RepID=UPI0022206EF1|nr:uncharacterized protein BC939DRAFT_441487 [Gamsiella multidivaricata]KAG0365252.1 hypothetical protein BGZ54_006724 [Gamsiella multidivaricata]KAI7829690.1 hypothetical protein BC939DRAFT_441487 [Gamsiella multidivaricata]